MFDLQARHVKCSEEKPHCRRSTSTGRICDGYSSSRVLVKATVKRSANELVMIHYVADVLAALDWSISRNTKEQLSFDYFRTRTATDLMACFNSEIWSSYVLQVAQKEPAVRHLVIAIGCLHEHFESDATGYGTGSQFALKQCSTAIQHVLRSFQSLSNQSTDIALVLCVLFASFEIPQGHYKSALTHIISGTNFLQERRDNGLCSVQTYEPTPFLKVVFIGLESQVFEIADVSITPT